MEVLLVQYRNILVAVGMVPFALASFWLTLKSIEKLHVGSTSYYPFNLVIPASKSWSVIYFFVILILLAGIIFIAGAGKMGLLPA